MVKPLSPKPSAPKPKPKPKPAPAAEPDSDDEEDEKSSKYPIPELIFTEEQTKKINKNYLSEIPQKIWTKIYKELGGKITP